MTTTASRPRWSSAEHCAADLHRAVTATSKERGRGVAARPRCDVFSVAHLAATRASGGILLDLARFGGGQIRVQTSDSCDEILGRDLATQVCRGTS